MIELIGNILIGIAKFISELNSVIKLGFMLVIKSIAEDLGIIDEDYDLEEIGLKYEKAKERNIYIEEGESLKDVLNKVEDVEINDLSSQEKEAYKEIGTAVLKNEIDVKAGATIPENLYLKFSQLNEKIDTSNIKIEELGNIVKEYDLTNEKINKYDKNEMKTSEKSEFEEGMKKILEPLKKDENIDVMDEYYKTIDDNGSIFG